jgi:hypothetical protein
MRFSIPEVILLVAAALYLLMVIDRICKCFEQCSMYRSLGKVYGKIDPNLIKDLIESKKET